MYYSSCELCSLSREALYRHEGSDRDLAFRQLCTGWITAFPTSVKPAGLVEASR
jgi:hypothetical protein